MILPMKRRYSTKKDPNRMLIFGAPKTGKTTVLANLDNCLIVDMEEGSDYVDAMVVKINNLTQFKDLMKSLDDALKANDGKVPYKFIALDTLTALEEMSLPLAKQLYMQTPKQNGPYTSNCIRIISLIAGKSL
jgi:SpoVK/Ycf46/Vps4 family AAA+-type ATPase